MSDRFFWLKIYVFFVLAFSCVYYGFWRYSPDSFIVNGELNLSPLSTAIFFTRDDSLDQVGSSSIVGLSLISEDLKKQSAEVVFLKSEISGIDITLASLAEKERVLGQKNQDEIFSRGDDYQQAKVAESRLDVARAEHALELFANGLSDAQKEMGEYRVKEAEMRVKVSEYKLAEAKSASDAIDYFMSNLGEFGNPAIVLEMNLVRDEIQRLTSERAVKDDLLLARRQNFVESVAVWRQQRVDVLNWLDFIFFSIGISTTTTYGDVVGNSRAVRAVIALQLIMCVFIMAGFVSSVIKSRDSHRCRSECFL